MPSPPYSKHVTHRPSRCWIFSAALVALNSGAFAASHELDPLGPARPQSASAAQAEQNLIAPPGAQSPDKAEFVELESPAGPGSGSVRLDTGADQVVRMTWIESQAGRSVLRMAVVGEAGFEPAVDIAGGEDWFVNWADTPAATAMADGTLIAGWLVKCKDATSGHHYEIQFSVSSDAGQSWSKPKRLHKDPKPAEHGFLSFAATPGEFHAVWLNGPSEGQQIPTALHSRTIGRDGSLGPEQVIDERVCDCCSTAMAFGGSKIWAVYRDRTDEEVRDIRVVRRTSAGWERDHDVHNDRWKIAGCPVNGPTLLTGRRQVVVAWFTGAEPASVLLAHTVKETLFSQPVRLDLGNPEGRVELCWSKGGDVYACWLENNRDSASWMLRSVSRNGIMTLPQELARVPAGRESGFAHIERVGSKLVFAYQDGDRIRVLLVQP